MSRVVALFLFALVAACGDDTTQGATTGSGSGGNGGQSGEGGASATTLTSTSTDATTSSTGAAAPGALSILTWNVEGFPKTSSAPAVVTATIAERLPIVAAFEEVDSVGLLEQALDAVTDYDIVAENEPPFALALAVDRGRAAILNSGSIFDGESYLFPRAPLVARIALTGTTFEVDVVVVHQKAQVDEESEQRRRDANDRLVAWCETRFASSGAPIVLVGDFNDQVTDSPPNDVFGAFKASTAPAYWFLTAPSEESGEHSYIPFTSYIDHQIATDNLRETFPNAQVAVLSLETQFDDYVSRVSDHRPVFVDFLP